jgi:hypothetical protein
MSVHDAAPSAKDGTAPLLDTVGSNGESTSQDAPAATTAQNEPGLGGATTGSSAAGVIELTAEQQRHLETIADPEQDSWARKAAATELECIQSEIAIRIFVKVLCEADEDIANAISGVLATCGARSLPMLRRLLDPQESRQAQCRALRAMCEVCEDAIIPDGTTIETVESLLELLIRKRADKPLRSLCLRFLATTLPRSSLIAGQTSLRHRALQLLSFAAKDDPDKTLRRIASELLSKLIVLAPSVTE